MLNKFIYTKRNVTHTTTQANIKEGKRGIYKLIHMHTHEYKKKIYISTFVCPGTCTTLFSIRCR